MAGEIDRVFRVMGQVVEQAGRANRWVRLGAWAAAATGVVIAGGVLIPPLFGAAATFGVATLPLAGNLVELGLSAAVAAEAASAKDKGGAPPDNVPSMGSDGAEVAKINAESAVKVAIIEAEAALALASAEQALRYRELAALEHHRRELIAVVGFFLASLAAVGLSVVVVQIHPDFIPVALGLVACVAYVGTMRFVRRSDETDGGAGGQPAASAYYRPNIRERFLERVRPQAD